MLQAVSAKGSNRMSISSLQLMKAAEGEAIKAAEEAREQAILEAARINAEREKLRLKIDQIEPRVEAAMHASRAVRAQGEALQEITKLIERWAGVEEGTSANQAKARARLHETQRCDKVKATR